jgi:hypothetical protein
MTTHLEDAVIKKIKAHMIEFPEDKAGDVAALFEVDPQKVYNARETLRRHKMLDRASKRKRKLPVKESVIQVHTVEELSPQIRHELEHLRGEIVRLNVIIRYLEGR